MRGPPRIGLKPSTDNSWRLTDSEVEKVKSHISERMNGDCWMCGQSDWLILPMLIGERPFDPVGKYIARTESAPTVRITCNHCGNIAYLSADIMDLLADRDIENEKAD